MWKFPKSWKSIYPFNRSQRDSQVFWSDFFKVILEIKDSDGKVLKAAEDDSFTNRLHLFASERGSSYTYEIPYRKERPKIILPIFIYGGNRYPAYSTIRRNIKEFIDIDKIKEIKNISVNIQDK